MLYTPNNLLLVYVSIAYSLDFNFNTLNSIFIEKKIIFIFKI